MIEGTDFGKKRFDLPFIGDINHLLLCFSPYGADGPLDVFRFA